MYSVVFAVILNGPSLGFELDQTSVRWQADYFAACGKGRAAGKPLAVFFGPGADGWRRLAREGGPAAFALDHDLPARIRAGHGGRADLPGVYPSARTSVFEITVHVTVTSNGLVYP